MMVMPLSMVPISSVPMMTLSDAAAAAGQADAAEHDDQDDVVDQGRIEDAGRHRVDRGRHHQARKAADQCRDDILQHDDRAAKGCR